MSCLCRKRNRPQSKQPSASGPLPSRARVAPSKSVMQATSKRPARTFIFSILSSLPDVSRLPQMTRMSQRNTTFSPVRREEKRLFFQQNRCAAADPCVATFCLYACCASAHNAFYPERRHRPHSQPSRSHPSPPLACCAPGMSSDHDSNSPSLSIAHSLSPPPPPFLLSSSPGSGCCCCCSPSRWIIIDFLVR